MRLDEGQLRTWMIGGLDGAAADHATLLRALVPLLASFFSRRGGGVDEIEDLVQETLIAIHTRRATYDRSRPFTAWLFAIARYKLVDHFRRRRRYVPIASLEEILAAEDTEAASHARLDAEKLLATLPDKQAHVIRSTHLDGYSVSETAAATGYGESDVKVSVHRGLKALAARIRSKAP